VPPADAGTVGAAQLAAGAGGVHAVWTGGSRGCCAGFARRTAVPVSGIAAAETGGFVDLVSTAAGSRPAAASAPHVIYSEALHRDDSTFWRGCRKRNDPRLPAAGRFVLDDRIRS
jgi:hypothetical protein